MTFNVEFTDINTTVFDIQKINASVGVNMTITSSEAIGTDRIVISNDPVLEVKEKASTAEQGMIIEVVTKAPGLSNIHILDAKLISVVKTITVDVLSNMASKLNVFELDKEDK